MFNTLDESEFLLLRDNGQIGEKTWPFVELGVIDDYFICSIDEYFDFESEQTSINRSFIFGFSKNLLELLLEENPRIKVTSIQLLRPIKGGETTFNLLNINKVMCDQNGGLMLMKGLKVVFDTTKNKTKLKKIYEKIISLVETGGD